MAAACESLHLAVALSLADRDGTMCAPVVCKALMLTTGHLLLPRVPVDQELPAASDILGPAKQVSFSVAVAEQHCSLCCSARGTGRWSS